MVDKEADFNPTKDIEELERFLANEPQSHFMEIQVHSVMTKPEPFIHTQQMSPLYEIFESYKSSTKPFKVDREMKSPSRLSLQGDVIRDGLDHVNLVIRLPLEHGISMVIRLVLGIVEINHYDLVSLPSNSILVNFCDEKGILQNFSSPYTPKQNGVAERKNITLIEAARTMLSGSIFSKQYWSEAIATACYTQNMSTVVKRHLKTPYEIFRGRLSNIDFLHVFGCPIFSHNHKDHLEKFNEKGDDGYFLRYSLVSKAFRVFNTRRQQTEETYHIIFDESTEAIKYKVDSKSVQYIEPYKKHEPIVTEVDASLDHDKADQTDQLDQNDLMDQNDHPVQADEILNDDEPEHSNHNNDNHIINNLPNTKDVQIIEPLSSPTKDTLAPNVVSLI
ncbi:retrovirus-related pol polyprotein from transposon TNT 1-94 [Tanacetum coccineum]|uniref:Retrovirus-related pol polyprotein from transposon TNT 1-94 n=1 Tax=Tanacetum coccineum TaxID=301880 RepID=A0ABQ4XS74_9ASTR